MPYYIHKFLFPTQKQYNLYNTFYSYKIDSDGFIELYNILEQNQHGNYNSGAVLELPGFTDTFQEPVEYVAYQTGSSYPNHITRFDLSEQFKHLSLETGLDGVILGESPSFKRCLFSSIKYEGDSDEECLTGDFVFELVHGESDNPFDPWPYINITHNGYQFGVINTYDNDFAPRIPHKYLFVLQGAGGGGGGGAELGNLFPGGSGGGSGGLLVAAIDFSESPKVEVHLGKGGVGSAEGSKKNGANGETSYIVSGVNYAYVYGGEGGGYARSVAASPTEGGGEGGTVEVSGFVSVLNQDSSTTGFNGAKGGNRGTVNDSENGANFRISQLTIKPTTLNVRTLNATGGTGGDSARYAGGGGGSFFGNGGSGGRDNAGTANAGGNGSRGAGGGGGGDATINDTYGKGGNGGNAVLKVYY